MAILSFEKFNAACATWVDRREPRVGAGVAAGFGRGQRRAEAVPPRSWRNAGWCCRRRLPISVRSFRKLARPTMAWCMATTWTKMPTPKFSGPTCRCIQTWGRWPKSCAPVQTPRARRIRCCRSRRWARAPSRCSSAKPGRAFGPHCAPGRRWRRGVAAGRHPHRQCRHPLRRIPRRPQAIYPLGADVAGVVECVGWPGCSAGFDAVSSRLRTVTQIKQIGPACAQRLPLKDLLRAVEDMLHADRGLCCAKTRPARDAARCAPASHPDRPLALIRLNQLSHHPRRYGNDKRRTDFSCQYKRRMASLVGQTRPI